MPNAQVVMKQQLSCHRLVQHMQCMKPADAQLLQRLANMLLQMTVDVLGVVSHCSSLGTVKRKADQSEVPRRDVTLVDKT